LSSLISEKNNNMEPVMDQVIIEVFRRMVLTHACSVDDILETPVLREEYLAETRRCVGDLPERDLLHRLTNLRRQKKLPRSRELV
jgi:hypothetical protein